MCFQTISPRCQWENPKRVVTCVGPHVFQSKKFVTPVISKRTSALQELRQGSGMKGERISLGGPFRRRSARGLENPAVNECPAELITSLSFPRPSRGVFHIEKLGPKKQRQSGLTLFPLSFPKKDDIRSSPAWSTTDEPHMLNGSIASQCWLIRATMAGLGGDTERERERERESYLL